MKLSGRTLFLTFVIAVVIWLGYVARSVVTPLVAALLLAYVLDPVVRKLERLGLSRALASGLVVAATFVALVWSATIATTRLVDEGYSFYRDVVGESAQAAETRDDAVRLLGPDKPDGLEWEDFRETTWNGRRFWYWDRDHDGKFRPGIAREGLVRLQEGLADHPLGARLSETLTASDDIGALVARSAGGWLSGLGTAARATFESSLAVLTLVVLFPIYLYYSLVKLARVYDVTVEHLPAAHRDRIVDILGKVHTTLSAFFRGRLILLLAKFVMLSVALFAFGVPFAGVCALFAALAALVPVLGSVVGGAVPVLLALADGATGGQTIGLLACLVVIEVIDGYVLTPAIIGTRVGMHPLTILVATFVAGDLLGIFGMLVAIPLTAIVKILWIEFVMPEIRRNAGLPDQRAAPAAAVATAAETGPGGSSGPTGSTGDAPGTADGDSARGADAAEPRPGGAPP